MTAEELQAEQISVGKEMRALLGPDASDEKVLLLTGYVIGYGIRAVSRYRLRQIGIEVRTATDAEQQCALDATVRYREDLPRKFYNGVAGEYLCSCITCHQAFLGDKRDVFCPDCAKPK